MKPLLALILAACFSVTAFADPTPTPTPNMTAYKAAIVNAQGLATARADYQTVVNAFLAADTALGTDPFAPRFNYAEVLLARYQQANAHYADAAATWQRIVADGNPALLPPAVTCLILANQLPAAQALADGAVAADATNPWGYAGQAAILLAQNSYAAAAAKLGLAFNAASVLNSDYRWDFLSDEASALAKSGATPTAINAVVIAGMTARNVPSYTPSYYKCYKAVNRGAMSSDDARSFLLKVLQVVQPSLQSQQFLIDVRGQLTAIN